MKRIFFAFAVLLPMISIGQDKGIKFVKFKSWSEVLNVAKKQHKNIFVDVFATWCGSCKAMDEVVYRDNNIGEYVNVNFIPVKIQFDQTKEDDDFTKGWYEDAKRIGAEYKITGFPTYLFLSPDGKIIDRSSGFYSLDDFFVIVQKANDPRNNFSVRVAEFKNGTMGRSEIFKLALAAKRLKQDSIAYEIARNYKKLVIDQTDPQNILNPSTHQFVSTFYKLFSTKDKMFMYLYLNPKKADSLMESNYAVTFTDYLIRKEYIVPYVSKNGNYISEEPSWKNIEKLIGKTFNKHSARKLVVASKQGYYSYHKRWDKAIKYALEGIKISGIDTSGFGDVMLNNLAYEVIFKHAIDKSQLNAGIKYMEYLLLKNEGDYVMIDTYANLLYKAGRKKDAVKFEQRALHLAEEKNDVEQVDEIRKTLSLMLAQKPTWPIQ